MKRTAHNHSGSRESGDEPPPAQLDPATIAPNSGGSSEPLASSGHHDAALRRRLKVTQHQVRPLRRHRGGA